MSLRSKFTNLWLFWRWPYKYSDELPDLPNNHGHYSTFWQLSTWSTLCGCFYPYPLGLLYWPWSNHMITPVSMEQPWGIWVNDSSGTTKNHNTITTKENWTHLGWGLLKLCSLISLWWIFSILDDYHLQTSNHIHIWQVLCWHLSNMNVIFNS